MQGEVTERAGFPKKAYNKTEIERVEKGAIEKITLTDKKANE